MKTRALLAVAAFAAVSVASAQVIPYSGVLDGSEGTFNRPAGIGALSGVGTDVYFDAIDFTVPASGTYDIYQATPGYDGYLLIYNGFNPADSLSGLIGINDDFSSVNDSFIGGLGLNAGTTYTLVSTTYANGSTGAYSGTITTVQAVPEPASMAALGLGGLALLRRRRKSA